MKVVSVVADAAGARPARGGLPGATAVVSFMACSTAITLANKHLFSQDALPYPWALLCVQSALVVSMLSLYQLARGHPPLRPRLLREMLAPCVLFTGYVFSSAAALRRVSLPALSVIKALAPPAIALAERVLFGDALPPAAAGAMVLVVCANAATAVTDLDASRVGYAWAVAHVAVNVAYVLSLRVCLSDCFTPAEKTSHANFLALAFMGPAAVGSGEVRPFFSALQVAPWHVQAVCLFSGVLCAGIGASIFWVVQTTSGTTLSFVGACNKFVIVVLGGILFKTNITPLGWVSVFIGVLAGVIFVVAKASAQEPTAETSLAEHKPGTAVELKAGDSDGEDEAVVKSLLMDSEKRNSGSTQRPGRA